MLNKRARFLALLAVLAVALTGLLIKAGLQESSFEGLWQDAWFQLTLLDVYVGVLLFWLWVAVRETSCWSRLGWLLALALLGNFASVAYLAQALLREKPGRSVADFLVGYPAN